MSAPNGSMAHHDLLVARFARWQEVERAYDVAPSPANCATADAAFMLFKASAEVCGMDVDEPQPVRWATARIASYGRLMGRAAEALALIGGGL